VKPLRWLAHPDELDVTYAKDDVRLTLPRLWAALLRCVCHAKLLLHVVMWEPHGIGQPLAALTDMVRYSTRHTLIGILASSPASVKPPKIDAGSRLLIPQPSQSLAS